MDFIRKLDAVMKPIAYGWVDIDGKKHTDLADFATKYSLQSPEELQESRLGVCWDQVELERELLIKYHQNPHAFNIIHYSNDVNRKMRTHTFVIFSYQNHVYWYEHAWEKHAGIHEFANQNDALTEIQKIFIKDELDNTCDPDFLAIYEYPTPAYHISANDFYGHCEQNGHRITL